MAPTYDELGRKFVGHDRVKIAKVDCTQEVNRGLCSEQNVSVCSDYFKDLFNLCSQVFNMLVIPFSVSLINFIMP